MFYFLELCFFEGGIYGGSEVLKKWFLFWFCNGFVIVKIILEDVEVVKEKYEFMIKKMDEDLSVFKVEVVELRIK